MKIGGVKTFDPLFQTSQLDWLVVPAVECPDKITERHVVSAYFRVPHEPWGPDGAFVQPVRIRRSPGRVLFRQESGVRL